MIRSQKRICFDTMARWKFGTSRPESATPPQGVAPFFFNPKDRRAIRKLIHDTVRGRISVPARFWRQATKTLQPDVAMDIGANYGECFASSAYPAHTRVIAIEANPTLIPYLEKTWAGHPSAAAIRLVNCIVDERTVAAQTFYFRQDSTGGGNAVCAEEINSQDRAEVGSRTVDQILQENAPPAAKNLVLKVDVEGHEGRVFAGFQSLPNFTKVAGIMEFDTRLLARAGNPAPELLKFLLARYCVFDTRRGTNRLQRIHNWDELASRHPGKRIHTDLVFLSSEAELPAGWSVST